MAIKRLQVSVGLVQLVAEYEGLGPNVSGSGATFRCQAYMAPEGQLTIALGHVIIKGEERLYLGGMSLAEAHSLYRKNLKEFLRKTAALDMDMVTALKNRDIKDMVDALNKWMETNNVQLSQRMFDVMIDLAFNAGPGSWDGATLKKRLKVERDEIGAALWLPMFCMAEGVYSPKLKKIVKHASPVSGLTFRRFSMVWYFMTGESWRIFNWAQWVQFLVKLNVVLVAKGRKNPLPYPRNTKAEQVDVL